MRHQAPFDHLTSHVNGFELSREFIQKWIQPFYMNVGHSFGHKDEEWLGNLRNIKCEITADVISKALGDFNWRTRQTGAFFAAMTNDPSFIDVIGTHLLKSELTYAGRAYCYVLASFNTPECINYLRRYLDYYLTRPDLWFDQDAAIETLLFLDSVNSTTHFPQYEAAWRAMWQARQRERDEIDIDTVTQQVQVIEEMRKISC